jgi:hypothetical protein
MAAYNFDEGTTDTAACLEDGSPTTARNLRLYNASGLEDTDLWAGAGDFTKGTSTLVMSTDGGVINLYGNTTDMYNLTINGNTTVNSFHSSGTNAFKLFNNLTVASSKTLTFTGQIGLYNSGATFSFATPATNVVNVGSFGTKESGTFTIPEVTINKLFLDTSGSNVVASGNHTYNTKLEVSSGATFNANGNTISCKIVDVNDGTLNLSNSTLEFYTSADDDFNMTAASTLLTGGTTITGAPNRTPCNFPPAGGFEVVGNVSNLTSYNDMDLTVIGSVTNCDVSATGANIRQFHHTVDTQQLLDADEEGDDDIKLPKPSLDNAHELQLGG